MARGFQIFGESLVRVKGGLHLPPLMNQFAVALGLSEGPIEITPRSVHYDIHTDDYGPDIPAELLYFLSEVKIKMTLIHFDADVLRVCIQESMAGGNGTYIRDGTMAVAGKLMGGAVTEGLSGNHYISLNIFSGKPGVQGWRFPTAYLDSQPLIVPLGTTHSKVQLSWRAIPYGTMNAQGEVLSSDKVLWTHTMDVPV